MSLFSYIFGFVSLVAVLVDRKEERLYTFHIYQALFLNLFFLLLLMPFYFYFLPDYILSLDVAVRTSFFLKATLIPVGILTVSLCLLGVMSYLEIKFKIPLIGDLARRASGYTGRQLSDLE
jgi:uncharacterized membrane protein